MAKLKPLPKAVLIAVVIGGIGYGIYSSGVMNKLPKSNATLVQNSEVQTYQVPAPVAPTPDPVRAPEPVRQTPAETMRIDTPPQAQSEPAPALAVSNGSRGLDALLKAGKK